MMARVRDLKLGDHISPGQRSWETEDLAKEVARIATLSVALGYKLEDENRILTKKEADGQISDSASLFKAILEYLKEANETGR